MNANQKNMMIAGGVIVAVLVIGSSVLLLSKKDSNTKDPSVKPTMVTSEIVPTVDPSVKVDLESVDALNHEVMLKITGIPQGTESIEYELSYQTVSQGLQGILPSEPILISKGQSEYEKKLGLYTESSGHKTYHQVVGGIKVTLKFNGSYGARSFEKEYDLGKDSE